jgi:hypothetical protein
VVPETKVAPTAVLLSGRKNAAYAYGTQPSKIDSDAIQSIYETWLNAYYEENGTLCYIEQIKCDS